MFLVNLILVDVCNVKSGARIHGSVREAIKFVTEKVNPFVQNGFKVELVVDASYSGNDSMERKSMARDIECVFTYVGENHIEYTADDRITEVILDNLKEKEYEKITLITDDLELRKKILFKLGPNGLPFELEFLEVLEFLNNKNSLV
ncbi:MAG: hypothetical protein PHW31_00220 [Candidatus Pacebacteria bacterium]|nr:hypothetical protein [Candidatus Paceibacterota bacterium]